MRTNFICRFDQQLKIAVSLSSQEEEWLAILQELKGQMFFLAGLLLLKRAQTVMLLILCLLFRDRFVVVSLSSCHRVVLNRSSNAGIVRQDVSYCDILEFQEWTSKPGFLAGFTTHTAYFQNCLRRLDRALVTQDSHKISLAKVKNLSNSIFIQNFFSCVFFFPSCELHLCLKDIMIYRRQY